MKTKNMLALSGLFVICLATNAFSETKFFTHTPYLSEADTPADFFCNLCDDCFTGLETFEDNSIDFGLIIEATNGDIIGPDFSTGVDRLTDSVDGDGAGSIDGVGNDGYSYFSPRNEITVTFPAGAKSAGLVWTDGDINTMTYVEAFGPGGSLGQWGPFDLSDDSFQGTTSEDTFFGVQDPGGVTKLRVWNVGGTGIEIDHVQFEDCTICIPEPTSISLGALAGLGIVSVVRRRR